MKSLLLFLLRRAGWMALTLWIVYTISFLLMAAVPGGPFSGERKLPPEIEQNMRAAYGLDRPLIVQYFANLGKYVTLNFGPSFRKADYTVNEIIAEGLPVSASLGICALALALFVGITAGSLSAMYRNSGIDVSLMLLATVGIAIPNFVLASVGILIFVFAIPVFPAAGWGTVMNLIPAAICLAAPFAAYIARLSRNGMLEVLGNDYIRTAYAKGLHPRRVILRHAMRGALTPVVTYLGPAVAGILTGSLVLEQIFMIPGLGVHFVEACLQRDNTLSMGLVFVFTALVFVMNTLVDMSYALIDPRVKLEN